MVTRPNERWANLADVLAPAIRGEVVDGDALPVHIAQVAGVQPAVPQRLHGQVGTVEVTRHGDRAAARAEVLASIARLEADGARFVNCPEYVRSWIAAEDAGS